MTEVAEVRITVVTSDDLDGKTIIAKNKKLATNVSEERGNALTVKDDGLFATDTNTIEFGEMAFATPEFLDANGNVMQLVFRPVNNLPEFGFGDRPFYVATGFRSSTNKNGRWHGDAPNDGVEHEVTMGEFDPNSNFYYQLSGPGESLGMRHDEV